MTSFLFGNFVVSSCSSCCFSVCKCTYFDDTRIGFGRLLPVAAAAAAAAAIRSPTEALSVFLSPYPAPSEQKYMAQIIYFGSRFVPIDNDSLLQRLFMARAHKSRAVDRWNLARHAIRLFSFLAKTNFKVKITNVPPPRSPTPRKQI
jgi:hypothetical protein